MDQYGKLNEETSRKDAPRHNRRESEGFSPDVNTSNLTQINVKLSGKADSNFKHPSRVIQSHEQASLTHIVNVDK